MLKRRVRGVENICGEGAISLLILVTLRFYPIYRLLSEHRCPDLLFMSADPKDACPVNHRKEATAACPVDHAAWPNIQPHSSDNLSSSSSSAVPSPGILSNSRQVSSIPRNDKENWVYPSEAQFYSAMARKNHDPKAPDMSVVVPIHNAVNERAWSHIQQWEAGRGGERCGGIRLVSFKGKPGEPSPKARILTLLGCVPFLATLRAETLIFV